MNIMHLDNPIIRCLLHNAQIFASYEKRQGQEPTVDRFTDVTQREMARESAVACLRKYTESVRDAPRYVKA